MLNKETSVESRVAIIGKRILLFPVVGARCRECKILEVASSGSWVLVQFVDDGTKVWESADMTDYEILA